MPKFCIGLLIMLEAFIFGCVWLMGHDLAIKEKIKIVIEVNVFAGILFFGFYLIM